MRRATADAARVGFAEAIALLARAPPSSGRVLLNRGNVHLQRGDAARAAADFTGGGRPARRTAEHAEQAKAEHNLGYARLLTGDLVGALRVMDDARAVLAPLSAVYRRRSSRTAPRC